MSLRFHWFLPTNGDGRDIVGGGHGVATAAAGTIRPASLAYLGQIARSAEQLGFEAALTPTGAWCEDAWLTTAMLTEVTERLKFLVAFRPGLISPTLSAQMAATFQRHSKGRLLFNVVTGGESAEQRAYGDFASKAERYERCGAPAAAARRAGRHCARSWPVRHRTRVRRPQSRDRALGRGRRPAPAPRRGPARAVPRTLTSVAACGPVMMLCS